MLASSKSKKATTHDTSSGLPDLFNEITDTNTSPAFSQFTGSICYSEFSTISVIIAPGAIALIEIPCCPYSLAEFLVRPTTPCLDAEYPDWLPTPLIPPTEAQFTILPLPCLCI